MNEHQIKEAIQYYNKEIAKVLNVKPMNIFIEYSSALSFAGQCRKPRFSITSATIKISTALAKVRTHDETKNTIVHELCHAYNIKNDGHGPYWRALANKIGKHFGFDISRCFSLTNKQEKSLSELRKPVAVIEVPEINFKKYIYRKDARYRARYAGYYASKNGIEYPIRFKTID